VVDPRRLFLALAVAFCGFKLALLAVSAWNAQFVMDEFNLVSSGLAIPRGFYEDYDPVKTVLHVYFYDLGRAVTESSVGLMRAARLQGLALALAMVALVWGIARNLGQERSEALFAVVVLLAFTTFLERSFRIRSEPLAVSFPLLALWLATGRWRGSQATRVAAGMAVGIAFLTTQKAAYYALAFGLAYLAAGMAGDGPLGRRTRRAVTDAALFCAGWAASVVLYAVAFGRWGFPGVVRMVFTSPLEVVFHGEEFYPSFAPFLVQTVAQNLLAYGLGACGLIVALGRWRRLGAPERLAAVVSVVITVAVFTNSQPWPYVFVMAIPFLAVWSPLPVRWASPSRRAAVLLVLLAVLSASFLRNAAYLRQDNAEQRWVMARAERLLAPSERYSDGVGMLPTRPWAGELWNWDSIAVAQIRRRVAAGDPSPIQAILDDQPKLWIDSYRLRALAPILAPILVGSYLPVDPNILLAGTELPPGQTILFENRWQGVYRLYGGDGRPVDRPFRVAGGEVRGAVRLGLGPYRVESQAAERLFLLPAGLRLDGPIPAEQPPANLFAGVYD
jgi:hypothetical protein